MPRAKGGSIPPPREMVPAGYGGVISTLNENDVLSGRGGRINNHPGNIMFRTVVEDYKREYLDPRTRKLEKAHVAARLVAQIRNANPPGRFLKEDPDNPGKYVEIGDQKAWKKAGQALREDAPEVRKEIDEEMETDGNYTPQTPHSAYPPGMPNGIPPAVSYSPTSAPVPLASPPRSRPDPPPAVGITGYRQPPLQYLESGRGSGPLRGDRYGRGPPPSHHHIPPQSQFPPSQVHSMGPPNNYPPGPMQHQSYPPQNYYGHPSQHSRPHPHHQQKYPQHPSHPPPHSQQHPYPHAQPQYPTSSNVNPQANKGMASNGVSKPKDAPVNVPQFFKGPINAVASGVNQTLDAMSGVANKVKQPLQETKPKKGDSQPGKPATVTPGKLSAPSESNTGMPVVNRKGASEEEFPLFMSTATNLTMSDVSRMTERSPVVPDTSSDKVHTISTETADLLGKPDFAERLSSEPSKTSSGKSRESMMSEVTLSGMNFPSFGSSGRTRSFPDLMLSTCDISEATAPAGDSDKEHSDPSNKATVQRKRSGRLLRPHNHRSTSSESSSSSMSGSLRFGGFHPVRSKGNSGMSVLTDAMSVMSIDTRRSSTKSDTSSWLEAYKSMQSVNSDQNPWELEGSHRQSMWNDDASIRSLLTDISTDLNALDLAEPLLPPFESDTNLDDSGAALTRPDP